MIRPENNGFSILIKIRGLGQAKYKVLADLPQPSLIKINHTDISHGYFQIEGANFFRCIGNIDIVRPVKLIWEVPEDWKLANSFGFGERIQEFRSSCRQLASSILAGGPGLRLTPTSFGVLGMSARHLNPAELIERLELNMKRVEEFWDDRPGPYFLVLVHQKSVTEPNGYGGTAHKNSFQLQLKGDESEAALNHLISHEYIHHWIAFTIKGPPVQDERDHLDIRWFIEGFTDYLAYDLSKAPVPEQSKQCPESLCPSKNDPLWVLKNFYKDRNYFQIPYYYGRRLAAEFEARIRLYPNSGKTLQDFMHDLLARSKRDPRFYITQNTFLQTICEGQYMDCNEAKDLINRYVILGESL